MTPEALARRHPRLYHLTAPAAWESIARLGLLPAAALIERFEPDPARRERLLATRRPAELVLEHPVHGRAALTDNTPLSERALAACLDDGLSPRDWLRLLNRRVFFWSDERGLQRLLGARLNRGRQRLVLVLDTLSLVMAHADCVEISPINSGATIRRPARRGLATFAPLMATDYQAWRRRRGRLDRIVEIVVQGSVPDIERHVVERRIVP
ncbi:DUF7002 family protein [Reyranella sp.]|uniref:DUF7002 family protein n=1 Tax=Reyranella sp. TaxID=1929291 RepID=UPI003BAC99E3